MGPPRGSSPAQTAHWLRLTRSRSAARCARVAPPSLRLFRFEKNEKKFKKKKKRRTRQTTKTHPTTPPKHTPTTPTKRDYLQSKREPAGSVRNAVFVAWALPGAASSLKKKIGSSVSSASLFPVGSCPAARCLLAPSRSPARRWPAACRLDRRLRWPAACRLDRRLRCLLAPPVRPVPRTSDTIVVLEKRTKDCVAFQKSKNNDGTSP